MYVPLYARVHVYMLAGRHVIMQVWMDGWMDGWITQRWTGHLQQNLTTHYFICSLSDTRLVITKIPNINASKYALLAKCGN